MTQQQSMGSSSISRRIGRWGIGVAVVLAALLPMFRNQPARAAQTEAYFVVDIPPRKDAFVIKLTDPGKIQHARNVLNNPQTGRRQVMGKIVKQPAGYNPPWSFHLDPQTIDFFDAAIEVCDGSMAYVESHLEEAGGAFLPGNVWCPWSSRLLREIPPPPGRNEVTSVSAANYRRVGLAEEAIVAAYGANLALTTEVAEELPLPTTLAGTRVKIADSLGIERRAPLFFVSPSQVNYLVPRGMEPGLATVTVTNANGAIAKEWTQLLTIAPALFTANADGRGAPAAIILRLGEDGSFHFEPVARFDPAQNRYVPAEINLGEEGDLVFLVLFGSGFRRNDPQTVSATIGGIDNEVMFAGANPDFEGLDQVNLQLSRKMLGRGEVPVILTVDDLVANHVILKFK